MEKGFLKGQSDNLPKIHTFTVMEFFALNSSYVSTEINGIKLSKLARESYRDDAIGYVQVKREGTTCIVKCQVTPDHSIKSTSYPCTVVCEENEEKVESVVCHSCAANSAGCEHTIAFLRWLLKRSEEPTTTSVKCYWTKPMLSKVGSNIKFIKAKDFKNEEIPVLREDPDFMNIVIEECRKRNSHNSQLMTYYLDMNIGMKVSIHYLISKFMSMNHQLSIDDFMSFCKHNITDQQCIVIEKETRNQTSTSLWYELQYGRIMASLAHKASICKTPYFCGVLLDKILGAYQFKEQIDVQRGKRLKDQIRAQIENIKNIRIKKCGLFLSKDYPTLGVCPYGLTEEHIIEIKCPQQNKLITKYINLTKLTPEYEAQVQLQMHFTNKQKALFCIAHEDFDVSKQFYWNASTLNPNYEGNQLSRMIPDDRLIRYTLKNWNFGSDFTGDITKYHNHCALVNNEFCQRKVSIVTADGSIDCSKDPGEQEKIVEYIHFCESITALASLKHGGSFVLKIFTIFEDSTINLLYLLNCLFEKVTIFKPCTSKSGNSEMYVINLHYQGVELLHRHWPVIASVFKHDTDFLNKSMFNLANIPEIFLEEIGVCANFFMKIQIKIILDNIYHFENKESDNVQSRKWSVTKLFFQYYHINIIPEEKKLVPFVHVEKKWRSYPENINNEVHIFFREKLINTASFPSILDIIVGKRIETVFNSMFCSKEFILLMQNNFQMFNSSSLVYQHIYKFISRENIIIDSRNFDLTLYYKFQYSLFIEVLKSYGNKNIIFFNVPLVSHFLVGLLYILICGFKKVVFWNSFIILYEPDKSVVDRIRMILNEINTLYKKINETSQHCDFERDIIQLVSPQKFNETFYNLINLVWNYNSQIFVQQERLLSFFKSTSLPNIVA